MKATISSAQHPLLHERFYTFVFRVTDHQVAQATIAPLLDAFRGIHELPGIEVTGVSMEDEMSKVERLDSLRIELRGDGQAVIANCDNKLQMAAPGEGS